MLISAEAKQLVGICQLPVKLPGPCEVVSYTHYVVPPKATDNNIKTKHATKQYCKSSKFTKTNINPSNTLDQPQINN